MGPTLKFSSLNCRGLRDSKTRLKIFQQLKFENIDIAFLQETHCFTICDARLFERDWGSKAIWAFGTFHSAGVGILLGKSVNYNIVHFDFDSKGRYLILDIDIHHTEFRLINIYAHNKEPERKQFISNLSKYLVTKRNVILGGDFNFVENLSLDKTGGSTILET